MAISGLIGVLALAGCAAADGRGADRPAQTTVPDLVGGDAAVVDKLAAAAGLVPIVDHTASAGAKPGTVVRLDPPAGTTVPRGSTITVVVAGPRGSTLDEIVAADRTTFVGVGVDPDGTTVVAIAPQASESTVRSALAGHDYRLRRCEKSWADLSRIVTEVTDLWAGKSFGIAVEPALCAVKVTGDIPAGALRARYGNAIVIEAGGDVRRLPRQ